MTKVRSKNTKPELKLRKLLWGMGYRGYRIHYKNLPGKPDIAFTRHKRAIFMHGCFWHGHNCKAGRNTPSSNLDYWGPKLERNKIRDEENIKAIKSIGWKTLIIWECSLQNESTVKNKIRRFCV